MKRDSSHAKMWIPGAPADRREVLALLQEARAADHVDAGRPSPDSSLPSSHGIVLAVAVDLHHQLVAALVREHEACLHRAADAEVERRAHDARAGRAGELRRIIGRAVVDDEHVELAGELAQGRHDGADRGGFVVRRDDGEGCSRWRHGDFASRRGRTGEVALRPAGYRRPTVG